MDGSLGEKGSGRGWINDFNFLEAGRPQMKARDLAFWIENRAAVSPCINSGVNQIFESRLFAGQEDIDSRTTGGYS